MYRLRISSSAGEQVGHHHGDEAARRPGADAVVAVLQYKAAGRFHAQLLCRQEEDFRVGLGVGDLLARRQCLEVVGQAPIVEVALDDVHPAGGSHCHGDVLLVQPRQQLIQTRLFGHRLLERFVRHPVQTVDDGVGVAVLSVETADNIP